MEGGRWNAKKTNQIWNVEGRKVEFGRWKSKIWKMEGRSQNLGAGRATVHIYPCTLLVDRAISGRVRRAGIVS